MKVAALLAATLLAAGTAAHAQSHADHVVFDRSDAVKWGPAPDAFPPGAQMAVLWGDPSKRGEFVLRLKLPKDYFIAPHTHPIAELVTVQSGRLDLGMGATADRSKTKAVHPGGFVGLPPGNQHYAWAGEDTVLEISGVGPFLITYLNPKDDPRNKAK